MEAIHKEQRPSIGFDEVVSHLNQYNQIATPHMQAEILLLSIDHKVNGERRNKVEDGYLITPSGNRFRLPNEDELQALKAVEEGARISVSERLGIDPTTFDDLHHAVKSVEGHRRAATTETDAPTYVTGQTFGARSMDQFLNGFRVLAGITGKAYTVDVMENTLDIRADESIETIEERLADSFREDKTLERFQSWNQRAAKRYEESPDTWPIDTVRQIDVSEIEQILASHPETPQPTNTSTD